MEYTDLPDGRIRRTINKIGKLWEISVCTFPAYEQTFVSARSAAASDVKAQRRQAQKAKLKRRFKHHA